MADLNTDWLGQRADARRNADALRTSGALAAILANLDNARLSRAFYGHRPDVARQLPDGSLMMTVDADSAIAGLIVEVGRQLGDKLDEHAQEIWDDVRGCHGDGFEPGDLVREWTGAASLPTGEPT